MTDLIVVAMVMKSKEHTIHDSANAPDAAESSRQLGVEETAESHLQHDDGVGLKGVLVSTLHRVELLGVLVVSGGVEVRVVDVVALSGLDDLVEEEAVHEEGAAED